MKISGFITAGILASLCISAAAQDYKPVKDKATKKFGYQDKSTKEWVIAPAYDKAGAFKDGVAIVEDRGYSGVITQDGKWLFEAEYDKIGHFDKNGLSEVMQKGDKGKLYGVINIDGRVIIPVDATHIDITKAKVILACRYKRLPEPNAYTSKSVPMWGVFDFSGKKILDCKFSAKPNILNRDVVVAKEMSSGLFGLYDLSGNCRIPHTNLALFLSNGEFKALGEDFLWRTYNDAGQLIEGRGQAPRRGYVIPYDAAGDDVRTAAYRHNMIGIRLHYNQVKNIIIPAEVSRGTSARCNVLVSASGQIVDWGRYRDNFVRLEPQKDAPGASINSPDGSKYALQAKLYDATGKYLRTLSSYGWIEAIFDFGVIYNVEGKFRWVIFTDVNADAAIIAIALNGWRTVNPDEVATDFSFEGNENWMMRNYDICREFESRIRLLENIGLGSYDMIPEIPAAARGAVDRFRRSYPVLRREFRMGQVLPAKKTVNSQGEVTLKIADHLTMNFIDDYSPSNLRNEGEETIWWGPLNDRFIRLDLIATPKDMSKVSSPETLSGFYDDKDMVNYVFSLAVNLYEDDGTFVRNLGTATRITYHTGHVFYIDELGLVFKRVAQWDSSAGYGGTVKFVPEDPIINKISDLGKINW